MTKKAIFFLCLIAFGAMAELVPTDPADFVFRPGRDAVIRFRGDGADDYQLSDYYGKPVSSGSLKSSGEQNREATFRLPAGYYELRFPQTGQTFGMLAIEPATGKTDPFFAMDCAMSWLVRPQPENIRPMLVKLLARTGIGLVRERMSWPEVEPEPGRWDFEGRRKNLTLRKLYEANKIELLDVIHNAPVRLGYDHMNYPKDLVATARAFESIAAFHDGSLVRHREVWNEPDLCGHDGFFATADAVTYAVRKAAPQTTLAGPVLSQHPSDTFLLRLLDDGQLDLFDVFSFHDYQSPWLAAETLTKYRKLLADAGVPGMPMWITESGKEWAAADFRPAADDDRTSAAWNVLRAIEAKAGGANAFFVFVLTYYGEGKVNYGMLGKMHTPLRSFATYAQLIRQLAGSDYAGTLKNVPENVRAARVFLKGDRAVVTLGGDSTPNRKWRIPFPVQAAFGIDGRALELKDNTVDITDPLIYLETAAKAVEGQIIPRENTPPAKTGVPRKPSAVVIDPDYAAMPVQFRAFVYQAEPTEALEVPLRLWNLGDTPAAIELTLEYPPEYAGKNLPVVNVPLTLEPGKATLHKVTIPFPDAMPKNGSYLPFKFRAADRAAGTVATRTVPLLPISSSIETVLNSYRYKIAVPLNDAQSWSKNFTPGAEGNLSSADHILSLSIRFPEQADAWAYPQHKLISTPEFANLTAVLARIRLNGAGDSRILLWQTPDVSYMTPWRRLVTEDGKWNLVTVPLSAFVAMNPQNGAIKLDPSKLYQIAVGFNSRSKDKKNQIEISDLYLVGGKK